MASLVTCPECERHIRRQEADCPFCGARVAERIARVPERAVPSGRLSRAALLAFGAVAAAGAAGCGGNEVGMAAYGAPIPVGAGGSTSAGGAYGSGGATSAGGALSAGGSTSAGGGGFVPAYGAPFHGLPPIDSGAGDGSDDAASAGGVQGVGGGAMAIYGAPTPIYGAPSPK